LSVDDIVVNAAGCGNMVKHYGYLLRDDPEYAARARAFSDKCKDISQLLVDLGPIATRHPLALQVAFHDPCHLQHAQGLREQPRAALRTIPGLELLELPEATVCCGSAGIYNLVQPETARQLGTRKVEKILATSAQVVATGNPGCQLQLNSLLNEKGHSIPVLHYVQLLDAAISARKI
jgi:glycolate oxidase iron-sulfur subunit